MMEGCRNLSCHWRHAHFLMILFSSGFIILEATPIQLTTESPFDLNNTTELDSTQQLTDGTSLSINMTKNPGWRFTSSGTEGFWYFPSIGNVSNSTKNEVFYTVLMENPTCYIKSLGGEEFARIEKMFIEKRAFKKSMVQLKLRVDYEGQTNEQEIFIKSSRFLKSSSKSDFKFLPWKLDHFSIIGEFIIAYYHIKTT